MLPTMKAIDYNAWMSIMSFLATNISSHSVDYGLSGLTIEVAPSYPKDLTKFKKPSIIVQKIHTMKSGIGFADYMGQYEDESGCYDVTAKVHTLSIQLDVNANSNTECSLLTSMISEGILDYTTLAEDDGRKLTIDLKDFTTSIELPTTIGRIDLISDIDVTHLSSNENDDYCDAIRVTFRVVRTIVDTDQEIIDLSKPLQITYKIIV